ncbi:hypothetical protein JNUCC74_07325 [Cerasibacillus sp. JNUCC 74]
MSRGLVAAGVDGEVKTFSAPPSTLIQTIRTGARYGVPIVASVIDFGSMVYKGEDVTYAVVKAGGHLGVD